MEKLRRLGQGYCFWKPRFDEESIEMRLRNLEAAEPEKVGKKDREGEARRGCLG